MVNENDKPFEDFSHLNPAGHARMVDTSSKPVTARRARADGRVRMNQTTIDKIRNQQIAKGDVLATARIAGIMAAKQTASLIPMCHPIGLDSVAIEFNVHDDSIDILATADVMARTGVEMEALVAVTTAALTIYDMCKSLDRGMVIDQVQLLEKTGGASGHYLRKESGR